MNGEFDPRGAPVEYWFWRFRVGELSFLVDFVIRHDRAAEVRVSLWVRGEGRVVRDLDARPAVSASGVVVGGNRLDVGGSRGEVGDVRWDLTWEPGPTLVDPNPPLIGRVHALDLEVLIRPDARFRGTVTVAGEVFAVDDVPGGLTHYWGRRLPDRWWWISAAEFDGLPGLRLEAIFASSRLWGRARLPGGAGFLWVGDGRRSDMTISPVNGIARIRTQGASLELDTLNLRGHRHRVRARAQASTFNDLGEGIRQTLLADLELDGVHAVARTVGLESRGMDAADTAGAAGTASRRQAG